MIMFYRSVPSVAYLNLMRQSLVNNALRQSTVDAKHQRTQRHQRTHFQMLFWRCSTNMSDLKFQLIETLPLYNRFIKNILKFVFISSLEKCLKFFPKYFFFTTAAQRWQTICKSTKHIFPQLSTILTSLALFRMCFRITFSLFKLKNEKQQFSKC